ncbi:hypothetical protein B8W69_18280 [Mycobacterium vulneris]|jgi:short-subunit dehydrogenase|uniref:Short-chain dehydrogenase n=1 Tax=Mycolicibacterium vulneris TaxID=547163 RepID=A0A1X2KVC5_9MYCO|nr:hypothetical protein B8W69_18280 [Mycolicibacterium vulneris]
MAAKRVLVTGAPSGLGAALADLALRAWDALGGVDVLINNAAMPKRRSVIALKPDEAEEVMRVNFFAPMRLTLALLPRMLARGSGTIVNVSSVGGRLGIIHESVYCASKVALCGWSEAMAVDLHDTPISVKLPEPGPVDTEIWDHPEKVVDAKNADLDAFITGAAGMAPR